jgi:hypothetical protein
VKAPATYDIAPVMLTVWIGGAVHPVRFLKDDSAEPTYDPSRRTLYVPRSMAGWEAVRRMVAAVANEGKGGARE